MKYPLKYLRLFFIVGFIFAWLPLLATIFIIISIEGFATSPEEILISLLIPAGAILSVLALILTSKHREETLYDTSRASRNTILLGFISTIIALVVIIIVSRSIFY